MKYKSVPTGTLVSCLSAWCELKYEYEYRANCLVDFDKALADKIMQDVLELSVDIQDVWATLDEREVRLVYDIFTAKYSERKFRTKTKRVTRS